MSKKLSKKNTYDPKYPPVAQMQYRPMCTIASIQIFGNSQARLLPEEIRDLHYTIETFCKARNIFNRGIEISSR